MFSRITISTIIIILFLLSFGYAQSYTLAKDSIYKTIFEHSAIDNDLRAMPIHHGTTLDHDYFEANRNADIKRLLNVVEKFHMDNNVLNNISPGRYIYALQDIKYTLERFPNHPKALLLVGSIAKLMDSYSLAIPYYERALRLFPEYAITHAQYGSYLVDIGRIEIGISKLKKAIEIDPNLTPAYAWLAKAYSGTGNLELARQAGARAKELGYKGNLPGGIQGEKAN